MMQLIGLAALALIVVWVAGGALWIIAKGIEVSARQRVSGDGRESLVDEQPMRPHLQNK